MFSNWIGVSNHLSHDCNRFADYELMSKQGNTVIYYRRSTNDPDSLDLRLELSLIRVAEPGSWVAGARLDRVSLPDCGRPTHAPDPAAGTVPDGELPPPAR